MKAGLRYWGRVCLLVALILQGTAPLDLRAEGMAGALTIAKTGLSAAAEDCCGPEASQHADECLPLCSTGGQAVLPATIELPLTSAQGFRPLPGIGADNRFADLEPDPPRPTSKTI
jgi:hypothetical protein